MDLNKETEANAQDTDVTAPAVVRVSQVGADNQVLDYQVGMTVGQCLERASITVDRGNVVTVNGSPAEPDQVIEANSVIVVAGAIKNG